ncbi:TPA: hypothetical protein ACJ2O6_004490 [Klebsiella pneumoniae]
MKTFNQLKSLIDFCQTDAFFLEHLNRLQIAGVIYLDCGEVIVSACVDHCREKRAKPYGTRLWAGQAVSARLVGK